MLEVKPELAVIDVSFISLGIVLPIVRQLLTENSEVLCLIKPQFEAKGVVREISTHLEVARRICGIAGQNGFSVIGFDYSPLKGPQGNLEYLLYVTKAQNGDTVSPEDIKAAIKKSHIEVETR
jgi:23S rRNA (cytidine1920-2'-O)/16S rRNA (cytidine1409-2'-O)-methyltransferase